VLAYAAGIGPGTPRWRMPSGLSHRTGGRAGAISAAFADAPGNLGGAASLGTARTRASLLANGFAIALSPALK
jgi:hypothetical protein